MLELKLLGACVAEQAKSEALVGAFLVNFLAEVVLLVVQLLEDVFLPVHPSLDFAVEA